jgi:methionyl-tRNA formyltransferase
MTTPARRRRIVFAGTPEFAAAVLEALIADGQHLVACYCQPDRPAGRGRKLTPPPVKVLAEQHGIPVLQPLNFRNDDDVDALAALQPDVMIVVAYGLILPQRVLDIPREGCINVHASLLPRWRGAAPIQRAIMAGDSVTGVTLMRMEAGLDTGPMLSIVTTPIGTDDTASSLHDRLALLGAEAMLDFLHAHPQALPTGTVQPAEGVTYAAKLGKQEADIDWNMPAAVIDRKIRGLYGWPVAQTLLGEEVLRLWGARMEEAPGPDRRLPTTAATEDRQPSGGTIVACRRDGIVVATGDRCLTLTHLQLPGGKALPVAEILNSRASRFVPGVRLGAS